MVQKQCTHPERKRIAYGEFCEVCRVRISTEPPPTAEQTEAYLKKLFGVK